MTKNWYRVQLTEMGDYTSVGGTYFPSKLRFQISQRSESGSHYRNSEMGGNEIRFQDLVPTLNKLLGRGLTIAELDACEALEKWGHFDFNSEADVFNF